MKWIIKMIKVFAMFVFMIPILLVFSGLILIPAANNLKLNQLEKQLLKLPLPGDSRFIEKQSVCGKLQGNGNGMNYLVTMVIESGLSQEELQEHYRGYEVSKQDGPELISEYLEHDSIYYDKLENAADYSACYVICQYTSVEFGSILEWDLRGH